MKESSVALPHVSGKSKSRRLWIARIALLSVILALTSLLAEFAFRAIVRAKHRKLVASFEHIVFTLDSDPDLEFALKPNLDRTHRTYNSPEAPKWRFRTNPQGFRDVPFEAKRGRELRILCLGDSYTFGWAIDDDPGPYPKLLEVALNTHVKAEPPKFAVFNLGVPGYSTIQERECLEREGDRIQPQLVILGFVPNDGEPQGNVPQHPDVRWKGARSWMLSTAVLNATPWLDWVPHSRPHVHEYDYMKGFSGSNRKGRDCKEALREIAEWCHRRNAALLVVNLPDTALPFDHAYPYARMGEQIASWCREFGCEFLDLWPFAKGRDFRTLQVPNEGHPGELAHTMIAGLIFEKLRLLGLIP